MPMAKINKNAQIEIICNVVFILPIENRALGTGISIFCVPKNSRRPEIYSSRAIIKMTGITISQVGIIMDSIINVLATNNLSPMWSITPPILVHTLYLRARYPSNQSDAAARANKIKVVQNACSISVGIIANAAQMRKADKKLTKNFISVSPFFMFVL